MTTNEITLAGIFTRRIENVETFIKSSQRDDFTENIKYLFINNSCDFDFEDEVKKYIKPNTQYKILRNEKIESLTWCHNQILFNAETDYIIHANDEVWFKIDWLKKTLKWINENDGINRIAHLGRCTKGYHKSIIPKIGYFNILLTGKDGSDSDIEYREIKYIEGRNIPMNQYRSIDAEDLNTKIIGGYWRKEFLDDCGYEVWNSEITAQPNDPHGRGDSNNWLRGNSDLSDRNLRLSADGYNYWDYVGVQGLEDISGLFRN